MTQIELLADAISRTFDMVNMTLADFSDADMMVRPCPGANTATWQIGHLITAHETFMNSIKPGLMPELPAGFADKFKKGTSSVDDPKAFPGKAQLLEWMGKSKDASLKIVKAMTPADLDKPGPFPDFCPTLGHVLTLTPVHLAMHLGQFQVIRRKLGKPVLF